MQKRNAVQLRLALSAAAACAVLAAATLSGGHRAGLLSIATSRDSEVDSREVNFDDDDPDLREDRTLV